MVKDLMGQCYVELQKSTLKQLMMEQSQQ